MTETFSASVSAWVAQTENRMEMVFKQSAQDVFEVAQTPVAMGGRMPVQTGFLRNTSFQAWLNTGTSLSGSADAYLAVIARADLGGVISGGWSADYAPAVEFGENGRPGRFFARGAALEWQAIVMRNSRLAQARFK